LLDCAAHKLMDSELTEFSFFSLTEPSLTVLGERRTRRPSSGQRRRLQQKFHSFH